MSLSLDDRLLGEKVHYYCSSDEEDDDIETEKSNLPPSDITQFPNRSTPNFQDYKGFSTNTGPKGVINDWREYKRLENERREESEVEKLSLAKKLSITCNSYLNDNEKEEIKSTGEDNEFLEEYRRRRLEEMQRAVQSLSTHGSIQHLTCSNYVDSIDKEKSNVLILIHVYNEEIAACDAMTGCFKCLAKEYPKVKFCDISAKDANLSQKFSVNGVPAILAYRNKQLIGNFIRVNQELGDDFYATDLEAYLQEHGVLPFSDQKQSVLRDASLPDLHESDFELD